MTFDPRAYGPAVADLLTPPRECALGPGIANRAAYAKLKKLTTDDLCRLSLREKTSHAAKGDSGMAQACLAGLWLYHDFFDESHAISQELHTAEGSYWHGILHRREPDYGNAKYWFRRVGRHAIFEPLRQAAAALTGDAPDADARFLATQTAWDPFRFINLCEAAHVGETHRVDESRHVDESLQDSNARLRETRPPGVAALCRQIQTREWQLLFDHCYRAAVS